MVRNLIACSTQLCMSEVSNAAAWQPLFRSLAQRRVAANTPRFTLFLCVLIAMTFFQGMVVLDYAAYWNAFPHGDNILHIGWGLVMMLGLVAFFEMSILDAFLLVIVWQFSWEAGEILFDAPRVYPDHFFFDGWKDTLMNMGGALLGTGMLYGIRGGADNLQSVPFRNQITLFLASMIPMMVVGGYWMIRYNRFSTWSLLAAASETGGVVF